MSDLRLHIPSELVVQSLEAVQHDLDFTGGDLKLLDGAEAIRQHIKIRLQTFLGEWFLDQRIGIPYFQSILVKNPNTNAVRVIFNAAILTTPGVETLQELELDFDSPTRRLDVSFKALLTDSEEPLVFDEFFIIEV